MNDLYVIKALQKGVISIIGSDIPIKAIAVNFTIPNDLKYLELLHIPNNLTGEFWGNEKTYRGLFRLLFHWGNDNKGVYPPLTLIKTICDKIPKGTVFTSDGISVKITDTPDLGGSIQMETETIYPVTLRYESFQV